MADSKTKKIWYKRWWAITLFILVGLIILGSLFGNDSSTSNSQISEDSSNQQDNIQYEILESWPIPNGGEGKKILISRDYLNEVDMTTLGSKLKQDTTKDRNAIIQVYTDRQAANLRDKVLANEATQEENELYDQHFVGLYFKNANNGNHQFNIFFDGTMGTNQKTINY